MNLGNTPEARDERSRQQTQDYAAESLASRPFTIAEVSVLLALEMSDWHTATARQCFEELGGNSAVFARIVAKLEADRVIRQHPRHADRKIIDLLIEGVRRRYERAVQAVEDR